MEYKINYNDYSYDEARNYDGTIYFNTPITVDVAAGKYIVPFGTRDRITTNVMDEYFYLVAENEGLGYISMVVIDTILQTTESIFLDSELPETIFEWSVEEQIKFLDAYLA